MEPTRLRLGIRREDKNRWEKRVPLTPSHVRALVQDGFDVRVQPSGLRAFADDAYAAAGARLVDDLSSCPIVMGVKEIPVDQLAAGKTYVFFSHTVKGQAHNMPMLRRLMDLRCSLVDYERVVDRSKRRLIFFGRHAGLAGTVETLRALGQRWRAMGIETPFAQLSPAYEYGGLAAALAHMKTVGAAIREHGLPTACCPLVIGVAGYGNVAQGVAEMMAPLHPVDAAPAELSTLPRGDGQTVYRVVFREEDMVRRRDGAFNLAEYYEAPQHYRGVFEQYLPHLTVLVNAIYWTPKYPVLVSLDAVRALYGSNAAPPRLQVLGDITCDIGGAIACTVRATEPDNPVYVWEPKTGATVDGVIGDGPVVMAVDNLPCEFPVEASEDFGRGLLPFVPSLIRAADAGLTRSALDSGTLPEEIAQAVIVAGGELAPSYQYLAKAVEDS